MNDVAAAPAEGKTANLIYILYLVGLILGITALVGLVMAYINRGDAPDWVKTHYTFQIRTFWIAMLFSVVGIITAAFGIGFLILLFVAVWLIVRCVKGMKFVSAGQAHPNPTGWLFS